MLIASRVRNREALASIDESRFVVTTSNSFSCGRSIRPIVSTGQHGSRDKMSSTENSAYSSLMNLYYHHTSNNYIYGLFDQVFYLTSFETSKSTFEHYTNGLKNIIQCPDCPRKIALNKRTRPAHDK
jgi:hypothetical protein